MIDDIFNDHLPKASKTALLDGDMVCFLIAVDKKQTDEQIEKYGLQSERTLLNCQEEVDLYIKNILKETNSDNHIGFLTVRSFRYDIYPEYKSNRKGKEPPKYLKQLKEYCKTKYNFIDILGYEADDLLATYQELAGENTIIVSTDKDMLQIKGDHYNPRTKTYTTIDDDLSKYYLWRQVLICDPVDNIKKSFRFGEKGVELLFKDESPHNYRDFALEVYTSKLGLKEGLNEFTLNFNLIYLVRSQTLLNEILTRKNKLIVGEIDRKEEISVDEVRGNE